MGAIDLVLPVRTSSADETLEVGISLAPFITPGAVVGFYGDLGAGKTQLIKGICSAYGIDPASVHSPTFTIVNEYASAKGPIYHFDAYRIEHLAQFYDLGYEDYFFGAGRCLIEWADRVESLLPEDALRIQLRHAGENEREILAADVLHG